MPFHSFNCHLLFLIELSFQKKFFNKKASLHIAVEKGYLNIVELLLSYNNNVKIKSEINYEYFKGNYQLILPYKVHFSHNLYNFKYMDLIYNY